ncbi:MAG: VOC family protein [Acidimicrobiia bacterium]|nr:VOC family protein [Acidimicrobiia bacterium]
MGTLKRTAPIFAVSDLGRSLAFYKRMGFAVREYAGGGYGFATRDGVELHLGVVPDSRDRNSAYVFVDDAASVADEWRAAGVAVHDPQGTEWGQFEGAVEDPDGNVIRFGSPMHNADG